MPCVRGRAHVPQQHELTARACAPQARGARRQVRGAAADRVVRGQVRGAAANQGIKAVRCELDADSQRCGWVEVLLG